MKTMIWILGLLMTLIPALETVAAANPTGITSCTSKVLPSTCESISGQLEFVKIFPLVQAVDFVVADPDSFKQIKDGAIDIVLADVLKDTNSIPMRHSPFDNQIIFEVTKSASVRCPNRVVISTDLFRSSDIPIGLEKKTTQAQGHQAGVEGFDYSLVRPYLMFIHGYIEGCWSRAGQP
ncbi:MAG: hypothetical protein WBE45_00195 [Terriglobales bacterium]|jgi:hypothetical protein